MSPKDGSKPHIGPATSYLNHHIYQFPKHWRSLTCSGNAEGAEETWLWYLGGCLEYCHLTYKCQAMALKLGSGENQGSPLSSWRSSLIKYTLEDSLSQNIFFSPSPSPPHPAIKLNPAHTGLGRQAQFQQLLHSKGLRKNQTTHTFQNQEIDDIKRWETFKPNDEGFGFCFALPQLATTPYQTKQTNRNPQKCLLPSRGTVYLYHLVPWRHPATVSRMNSSRARCS